MASLEEFRTAIEHMSRLVRWDTTMRLQQRGVVDDLGYIVMEQQNFRDSEDMLLLLQDCCTYLTAYCTDTPGMRRFSFLCAAFIQNHMNWSWNARKVSAWNPLTNRIRQELIQADHGFRVSPLQYQDLRDIFTKPVLTDADVLKLKLAL